MMDLAKGPAGEIVFLSRKVVRSMLTFHDAVATVEEELTRTDGDIGAAIGIPAAYEQTDRMQSFMWRLKTAILRKPAVAGVRVAGFKLDENGTGSGGEEESTRFIVLSDPATGSPLAIIDEHWSFGMRTVAASAVAVKHLARPGATRFGVIGVGHIGRLAVRCLHELFGASEILVTSLRPSSREAFAADMSHELGISVRACSTAEEVCRNSEVVIACTPSRTPYIEPDWLNPGGLTVSLGQFEATPAAYAGCDRLFVDYDRAGQNHPAHIAAAIRAGAIGERDITGELWEVVSGRTPGRVRESDRVILVSVGRTTQDIAIAYHLYQRARARGIGVDLSL